MDELKNTVDLMLSTDYRERLRGEYQQVHIRVGALIDYLEKLESGELDETPVVPVQLLKAQAHAMMVYELILIQRAAMEGVEL